MANPDPRRFTFDELCSLTELPRRTVRYYVQLGLVDRPIGETRAAYYTGRHLDQLLQVRKWTQAGVSLDRIRELLHGAPPDVPPRPRGPGTVEVWSHLVVADRRRARDRAGARRAHARAGARAVRRRHRTGRAGTRQRARIAQQQEQAR